MLNDTRGRKACERLEMRGKGIGRALILDVYARARDLGVPRVYWQTHETNRTAQKLYDAVADRPGFTRMSS